MLCPAQFFSIISKCLESFWYMLNTNLKGNNWKKSNLFLGIFKIYKKYLLSIFSQNYLLVFAWIQVTENCNLTFWKFCWSNKIWIFFRIYFRTLSSYWEQNPNLATFEGGRGLRGKIFLYAWTVHETVFTIPPSSAGIRTRGPWAARLTAAAAVTSYKYQSNKHLEGNDRLVMLWHIILWPDDRIIMG